MKTEPQHSPSAITVTAMPSDGKPWQRRRRAEGDRDDALPNGTRLNEFEVLGVLGAGGFGIVYLAMDHTLRRTVAVKEYLPVDFARRTDKWTVVPRGTDDAPIFIAGLQSFIREAQLLAGFDHPSLVKVHRFWKANGTGYMVMPHYPGRTLKEVQRTTGALRDEQSLRRLLHPLLSALEALHEASVYHRDISPDNIILTPDGKPVLLDFGSARHVVADRTQALTAMFKPSFAAIEQYGDVPGLRQGAWTDLYALGGVMHFMITGSAPVPAALRAVNDAQPRLAASPVGQGGVSIQLLEAIDWALAVRPDQRPQSVSAFREVLDRRAPVPAAATTTAPTMAPAAKTAAVPLPGVATVPTVAMPSSGAATVPSAGWVRTVTQPRLDRRILRRTAALVGVSAALCLAIWARHEPVTASPARAPEAQATAIDPSPSAAKARSVTAISAVGGTTAAADTERAEPESAPARSVARGKDGKSAPAQLARSPTGASTRSVARESASGPREACGDRNFVSMASCMDRQCQDPAFRAHAQCESFRRYAEARRQSELSR